MGLDMIAAYQSNERQNNNVLPVSPFIEDTQGYLEHLTRFETNAQWRYAFGPRWYGPGYKRGDWLATRAWVNDLLCKYGLVLIRHEELWWVDAREVLIRGDKAFHDDSDLPWGT